MAGPCHPDPAGYASSAAYGLAVSHEITGSYAASLGLACLGVSHPGCCTRVGLYLG